MPSSLSLSAAALLAFSASVQVALANCPNAPNARHPYVVASGWQGMPVLGGLSTPRGVVVDGQGNLLVLERGKGISGHTLDDNGCVRSSKLVVEDPNLNHGIDVAPDGRTLIASTPDVAYEWQYNADDLSVQDRRELVTGMLGPGHNSRTVHNSRRHPDHLVISVGSGANIDEGAFQVSAGRSQIRSFNKRQIGSDGVAFTDENAGEIMAFGVRNAVGIAEDREGTIHAIDNSVDDAYRVNVVTGQVLDIHNDNPAEKVYALGPANQGNSSYFAGAPYCYTVWDPEDIPDVTLRPGDYFALQPNSSFNDGWCASNAARPSLVLPPHTAPLDMKFGVRDDDNNLYIGLHGSYNRAVTVGYKVLVVPGEYNNGRWEPADGIETPSTDLLANDDESDCGDGDCFRPVGLAFTEDGDKLYVTSDTSGEVFLVKRGNGALSGFRPQSIATVALALPAFVWFMLL